MYDQNPVKKTEKNNAILFSEKFEKKQNNKNPFQEIIKTIIDKKQQQDQQKKKHNQGKISKGKNHSKKNNKSKNIHENYVFVWFFPISKHKLSFWSNKKSNIIKILYFNF